MKFDFKEYLPFLDIVIDKLQSAFIAEDKELENALVDAGQTLIKLAVDGVDNKEQGKRLATVLAKAIADYNDEVG